MALQLFASRHPEFDYFWNWEMDVRYTGNYRDLLSGLTEWAATQPRSGIWDHNKKFFIPPQEDFADAAGQMFGHPTARHVGHKASQESTHSKRQATDEADLITPFPMFDTYRTFWPHKDYLVNYGHEAQERPDNRYGTVTTQIRLSRKLLDVMAEENVRGHAMASEMWPPTMAATVSYTHLTLPTKRIV